MRSRDVHLLAILAALGWNSHVDAAEIPVEVFFQRAAYSAMQISPSGEWIAAIARVNGRNNPEVIDLQKREVKVLTNRDDVDILQINWINDNRLLIAAGDAEEASGKARFQGWFAVDRDGSRLRHINGLTSFLGRTPGGGDDIIMAARVRSVRHSDIYELNTVTLKSKLLSFDHPGDVYGWMVDRRGIPRVARSYLNGKHTLWYRESGDSPWAEIAEGTEFRLPFVPLAFDYDNKTLFITAERDGDKLAVYTYDFSAKKPGELIAGSPQVDVNTLIFSRSKRALVGVRYQADKPGVVWFDADIARLQKTVDQVLPDTFNFLQIPDENMRRVLVYAYSDVNAGTYYLLDTDTLKLQQLAETRPWLDPKQMAERKPIHYTARDGLEIPGYLTLPKGSADNKLPLVVIIHGGPWVRGFSWGFDLEAQFFASRGYAVLEPEFRGSAGHGSKLFYAGVKQWGLAMQDDITDGVEWAIKEGIVDKNHICSYGGSYGGYATLWGLIKTPDLYKCGVAFVAVTDISLLFDVNWEDLVRSPFWDYGAKDVIGDPDKDAEKFKAVSPLANAEKLKVPVLLAYGGSDPRVPIRHGNEFRAALDKYGKTYEWVVYRDEGHGFNKDENRFDFYRRVDAFLKQYLR